MDPLSSSGVVITSTSRGVWQNAGTILRSTSLESGEVETGSSAMSGPSVDRREADKAFRGVESDVGVGLRVCVFIIVLPRTGDGVDISKQFEDLSDGVEFLFESIEVVR